MKHSAFQHRGIMFNKTLGSLQHYYCEEVVMLSHKYALNKCRMYTFSTFIHEWKAARRKSKRIVQFEERAET